MPRGTCLRHGAERPCSCAMGNLYRFVEPLLLCLLKKKGCFYGYELMGALEEHALTDTKIEHGALYRTLRRLESNGHVVSEWDNKGSGPSRRMYKLTNSGDAHLLEWEEVLDHMAKSMADFVQDVRNIREGKNDRPV